MKLIIFYILILFCFQEANAQAEPVNRISIGIGIGTVPEIIDATDDLLETVFSDGTRTSSTGYSGAWSIQYDRAISDNISVGVGFIYEAITKDVQITTLSNATYEEGYKANYSTILLNGTYSYLNKDKFELYARLGLGATFRKEELKLDERTTDNDVLFAYQISPIGFRAGRKVYFKAEAGFGYMGIFSIGGGYRF